MVRGEGLYGSSFHRHRDDVRVRPHCRDTEPEGPEYLGPRINSRKATAFINALSIVVIALYVGGLFF
ncbi:hypothetical protein SAMN04487917_11391 [Arthrobacter sp. yr096]|uniref:hypothetical protein n=1 Tax=Arthrobacter sp. yr096 TaxID=1761750 RepID=UPI0008B348D4|nr:hypothetical protein [Arthrobacter sp. yr096]SEJ78629.1 hypothetical protein SAMN04487917_11391 [Arthrobacter sp. yr096]